MPNPTQADLHINAPLSNVSVAYLQDPNDFIARKVFPVVPVAKQSDLYWKFSKSDTRRTDVKRRAPGTKAAGTSWKNLTDSYFAYPYSVRKDLDDQTTANADSMWNLEKISTENLTNQLLINQDIEWSAKYFTTGVWTGVGGTDQVGVATAPAANQFQQWDQAGSDPVGDVANWHIRFRETNGRKPNKMVLGADVMRILKQHPDIIDRIKYTQKGIVSEDLIATLFDVDEILVAYAPYTSVAEINDAKAQDAAATYSYITNTKAALLCYSPTGPALQTPAAGYTFAWTGLYAGNSAGIKVKRFRLEEIESNVIEASMAYDMKVVSPDMGVFASAAVS
jgi:hypothetical protein